jgi:hypothetical protein
MFLQRLPQASDGFFRTIFAFALLRHSSRLKNGPHESLPPPSIAYQPGLMPRMSDLFSLIKWGMLIVAPVRGMIS